MQCNPGSESVQREQNNYALLSAKITKFIKSNKSSGMQPKSKSMNITVTATTLTHPEVIGLVTWGIVLLAVRNVKE